MQSSGRLAVEYLTDAPALLWHLYRPQRLGEQARQVFADADAGQACIHVPAVVAAEVLMVVQKGRLRGVRWHIFYLVWTPWRQVTMILSVPYCLTRLSRATTIPLFLTFLTVSSLLRPSCAVFPC
ncbi:hypothetical protein C2W62_30405 [Candidatus Entotheonella serta]|nr:hypothetical protein C2W62_30405 [Candidatus Entotheonella serta]